MLELTISGANFPTQQHSFEKTSIMLGRAAGNDVALEASGISRYHTRLFVEDDEIYVEDLGSTNGTFVNSERVTKVLLKPTDKLTIGELVVSVQLVENDHEEPETDPLPAESVRPTPVSQSKPPEEAPENSPILKSGDAGEAFYWKSLQSFLAPVWSYINDDSISEIMINGPAEIYYEQKGHLHRSDITFSNEQLKAAVLNIAQYVGRRVSEEEPYLDARLPDGSRVAVLLPPCAKKGISIAIRKFAKEKLTLDRLVGFGSISQDMITFLRAAVLLKKNLIVSGGTSSGKTSLLNVVSGLIPDDERIITIEDAAELQLTQDHVVPMETKPPDKKGRGQVTIRDLVRASLRMRPDRIIVGEIRGGEALDLLQAMNTGHSGSMATVHASSPAQALTRLETLALFSGLEIPVRALRDQVSTAIDIVVQAARLPDHSRKVTHISEITELKEDGTYQAHDIFRFQRTSSVDGKIQGQHIWTGYVPSMLEEMEIAGLTEGVQLFKKEAPSKA